MPKFINTGLALGEILLIRSDIWNASQVIKLAFQKINFIINLFINFLDQKIISEPHGVTIKGILNKIGIIASMLLFDNMSLSLINHSNLVLHI